MGKVKTVFELTPDEIEFYQKERLWPQESTPKSTRGRSSISGFLARNEKLMDVANRDKKMIAQLKVSFKKIAGTINKLLLALRETPDGAEINNVQIKPANSSCVQPCPFSPKDDSDCETSPFTTLVNMRNVANRDVTITNLNTGEYFTINSLLVHLIKDHHFFDGSVEHRLDPDKVIRVLNIASHNKAKTKTKKSSISTQSSLFPSTAPGKPRKNQQKEDINTPLLDKKSKDKSKVNSGCCKIL